MVESGKQTRGHVFMQTSKLASTAKAIVSAATALAITGCITLKKADVSQDQLSSSMSAGSSVVIQAGQSDPVFSGKGDGSWVQVAAKSDSILSKAEAALASGEGAQAENLARSYLQSHPADPSGLLYLANALVVQQRYQQAAYYAGFALRSAPGESNLVNIQALSIFMNSNGHIDDIKKAEQLFLESLNSSSQQVAAGLNLGRLYMAIGRADQAAEAFKTARERCNCLAAMLGEGAANIRLKKFSAANYALEQAKKVAPSHPSVMYQIALVRRAGYNDKIGAAKSLEGVLASDDPRYRNLREKAQSMLRQIRSEAELDERLAHGKAVAKKSETESADGPSKELVHDLSNNDE